MQSAAARRPPARCIGLPSTCSSGACRSRLSRQHGHLERAVPRRRSARPGKSRWRSRDTRRRCSPASCRPACGRPAGSARTRPASSLKTCRQTGECASAVPSSTAADQARLERREEFHRLQRGLAPAAQLPPAAARPGTGAGIRATVPAPRRCAAARPRRRCPAVARPSAWPGGNPAIAVLRHQPRRLEGDALPPFAQPAVSPVVGDVSWPSCASPARLRRCRTPRSSLPRRCPAG